MKLSVLLMLLASLQISAAGLAQAPITLFKKNVRLEEVLRDIKKQTGYDIFYIQKDMRLARPVTVSFSKAPLGEALADLFAGQPLEFVIDSKTIIVQEKRKSSTLSAVLLRMDVTGRILDENGEGLPGATVRVKGGSQNAMSDTGGNFTLKNVPDQAVLEVSYIGYITQEIPAKAGVPLTIKLVQQSSNLNDVVVVGYGSQKKANLIGSVAQLSARQINDRPVPSLSNALTGQLPGVTIIQRSGQPGSSGGNIQIRGVGSFGAASGAFILVDGVPVNSFNDIDPNDVENISVLKDASTAAIYGSRAANGVILVTTKSGKSSDGKVRISYNGYAGSQRATAYPEFANSWEYAAALNEAQPGSYTEAEIQKFRDGTDPDNYPNIDYVDLVLKKSTLQTGHNLSLSNETKNTQYLLAFGYLYQNGIVEKNDYSRYNLRLNLTNTLAKNLKLTTRFSAAQYLDNQPAPPVSLDWTDMITTIGQVIRVPAVYPYQLSNGDFGLGVVAKGTPYTYSKNESFFQEKKTDLLGNARLDWDIIPGLKISAIGAYTQLSANSQRFLANQRLTANVVLGPGTLNQQTDGSVYKTLQQLAEYKRSLGKSDFGVLLGHSYEYTQNSSAFASRSGYFSNNLTELNAGDAGTQKNNGTAAEFTLDSYFGRLNYSFANRYLVEGTLRYDGSSRFPQNNKYAFFPAVALGWRISEEKFLKNAFSWLNDLKLKGSYGTLGNQNIGNYAYQNVLSSGQNYVFGNTLATGVANLTLVDPNIRWESTRTKDIGLDATLFKSRLNLSVTYFDRYTYDILVSPGNSVSKVLGTAVGVQNSGKLSNRGWEFTADYNGQAGAFSYGINTNFSIISNKVLDLGVGNVLQPNGLVGNGSNLFIGSPMNVYYGYVADGLFRDASDVAAYANQKSINPGVRPGDIRYKDISGPAGVPDGKVDATYDRTVLGSQIPRYTYGLSLRTGYKNFELSVLLQGVAGVKGMLSGYAGYAFNVNGNIQRWQLDSHWSEANPNPNAKYPRLEVISNQGTPNTLSSSFWLLSGSYLKVRNIQLGYAFDGAWTKKLGLRSLRLYGTAQNPFAFSQYPTGWDPEINTSGGYYPILANYTLGLNVNF
ncbi:TonB-dependent receptor [Pedobacter yulinensis]|nr:TonB-dependent receptor [Pedobacter yulinensis]